MARILLAEDDTSMREYLQRALQRVGYEVAAVGCGTEAMPLLETEQFDLLLTDIVMPEMDGIELAQKASAIDPSIRPSLAALLEGIAAFMLVLVVFGSAVDPRAPKGFYGLAIGLTLTANILMGGVLTGMAFNPARAFGPALVAGFWQDQWVYWVGPLLGGGVAGILYDRFFLERA